MPENRNGQIIKESSIKITAEKKNKETVFVLAKIYTVHDLFSFSMKTSVLWYPRHRYYSERMTQKKEARKTLNLKEEQRTSTK